MEVERKTVGYGSTEYEVQTYWDQTHTCFKCDIYDSNCIKVYSGSGPTKSAAKRNVIRKISDNIAHLKNLINDILKPEE